ncbi:MAG TPA: 7TM diverse intracellular signaling domain-containing protein [Cyclobacteriaceae bacterium]|jgi:hypothetical protein
MQRGVRVRARHFLAIFLTLLAPGLAAQQLVQFSDSVNQHLFSFAELYVLEDPGSLTIDEVTSEPYKDQFKPSTRFYPVNTNRRAAYWLRIKVKHPPRTDNNWVIEFFDQTIDHIEFYTPYPDGTYQAFVVGDAYKFPDRFVAHKNFVVPLQFTPNTEVTYYARVKSEQHADMLLVLRSQNWLFEYALDEYFFFGIFYGMILVFGFYNLLMFLAVRERYYLYYILYLASIGLYEMSADGIGFQYLWPNSPGFNYYATGLSLFMAVVSALLFSSLVLNLRNTSGFFHRLFIGVLIGRTALMVASLTVWPDLFKLRFIEIIPFLVIFYTSIYYFFVRKYMPARFLVAAYAFVAFGAVYKVCQYLGIGWQPLGALSHYTLGISFIIEMLLLSFAISDKIRLLRLEKARAQEEKIEQLHENQRLKDNLNRTLEEQVRIKTAELLQKQAFIEEQNAQLELANHRLEAQAREIAAINEYLALDNQRLLHDITEVKEARALSRDMTFEEFCSIHPEPDGWTKFIADLKWQAGYSCRKCGNESYSLGRTPFSRRCTRCGYDESAIANTLLQGTHLPIEKALYLVFLVYNSQGAISSHKLSELLDIRQSTCWSYSSRIKSMLKERQKAGLVEANGWSDIIITQPVPVS